MADLYGVASMTAQRALRELQNRRITYSVAGKGTFVHPDAFDLLRGAVLQEPIAGPELRGRVAAYLADQRAITRRFHAARTADDRNALNDLVRHADAHSQLIDDVIKYQADHGNYARQPAHLIRDDAPGTAADEANAEDQPASKKTRRPRKADNLTARTLVQNCST